MVEPVDVPAVLRRHVQADGLDLVLDTAASRGSWLVDARDDTRYLDLFTFFASSALGMNHPALTEDAAFRATRHAGPPPHPRLPRPQRLHDVADEHRPREGRPLPEVRLAPDRRVGPAVPPRRPPPRGRGGGDARARPGRGRVRRPRPRHRLLHRRTDPGGGRRQPPPRGVPPGDAGAVPAPRRALRARRGPDRLRADRHAVGLPAPRPRAGRRGVREEAPGLRDHGGPAGRRRGGERLPGHVAHQLDVGRQPHRHGPRAPRARGGRGRRPRRAGRHPRQAPPRRALRPRGGPSAARHQRPRARADGRARPADVPGPRRGHPAVARRRAGAHARMRAAVGAVPAGADRREEELAAACAALDRVLSTIGDRP